jgi:hypothetical protein
VLSHVTFDVTNFVEDQITVLKQASIINVLPLSRLIKNKKRLVFFCLLFFHFHTFNIILKRRDYSLGLNVFMQSVAQSFFAGIILHIILNDIFHVVKLDQLSIILPFENLSRTFFPGTIIIIRIILILLLYFLFHRVDQF